MFALSISSVDFVQQSQENADYLIYEERNLILPLFLDFINQEKGAKTNLGYRLTEFSRQYDVEKNIKIWLEVERRYKLMKIESARRNIYLFGREKNLLSAIKSNRKLYGELKNKIREFQEKTPKRDGKHTISLMSDIDENGRRYSNPTTMFVEILKNKTSVFSDKTDIRNEFFHDFRNPLSPHI